MRMPFRVIVVIGVLGLLGSARVLGQEPSAVAPGNLLARRYQESDSLHYHMRAIHESRTGVVRYEADAASRVARDSAGRYLEDVEWSALLLNGALVPLPAGTPATRQRVTLSPAFMLPPDVAHADPRLVGPVLDFYTFYVDLWLAAKSPRLARAGDQVRIPGRGANSWADGRNVILGQDAVDFVITLLKVDSAARIAQVLVQHVPPAAGRVPLPADWMQSPVDSAPNNWVQVEPAGGKFVAGVGQESFDVWLVVSLADGRILAARMDNPVDIVERTCTDRALTECDPGVRGRIRRQIWLDLVPPW